MSNYDELQTDARNMGEALDGILDKAEKLLGVDNLPPQVKEGLDRIIALARYRFEVRTDGEIKRARQ